jgi:hypothetical protein
MFLLFRKFDDLLDRRPEEISILTLEDHMCVAVKNHHVIIGDLMDTRYDALLGLKNRVEFLANLHEGVGWKDGEWAALW